MIQEQSLSDFIQRKVYPSVWNAYHKPFWEMKTQSFPLKNGDDVLKWMPEQITSCPQYIQALKMADDFFSGSLNNFCCHYLDEKLTAIERAQILLKAHNILKTNNFEKSKKPLVDALALKTVFYAHMYANNMFSAACFLRENKKLPKELEFMFERGISPALYPEPELFQKCEWLLYGTMKNAPDGDTYFAFNDWYNKHGEKFNPSFAQYINLIREFGFLKGMGRFNELIYKNAVDNTFQRDKRKNPIIIPPTNDGR